ncbi:Cobalt-precorrin-5B C(1)-methyltransferase [BD1-7 clade bacterium]|uniref:Cobalt-precorrin-5B C(1)-methyltransferase n=1 Tax=BD1-7 clade bacterium TaxID=2029982 RepID=A0A5S9P790_9GAMM|nr:Cobalt-precorrin-5B C(1)-methyltransferase [BD1-7 clade bacterium]
MWPESEEQPRPLRNGLTTGSCATACCVAAAQALFAQHFPSVVSITLPKGKIVELPIQACEASGDIASASTIKDAGDDPDVTHGALVQVTLRLLPDSGRGIDFKAGKGVGTVTRTGLVLAVGDAAINPVPRQMISDHLIHAANKYGYAGGFEVTVSVRDGEALALKTMNPRLGILGGLSILGTTGIVRPFSCAAYIASIHQGIDVARANGHSHLAATTGNASEGFIQAHYGIADMALIEMGDFAGAVLKYLRHHPVNKMSLCGGFGKISKLAAGHMDLHSSKSSIDLEQLAEWAAEAGAESPLCQRICAANTSVEALGYCQAEGIDLASLVCRKAVDIAWHKAGGHSAMEVWAVDRRGKLVGYAVSGEEKPS